MDIELLQFLIRKSYKIYLYEYRPITNEQFFNRRLCLFKALNKAKKNYRLTADKKYLKEITRIKETLSKIVSRTEYELCKSLLENYKKSYNNIIYENYWDYESLCDIYYLIAINEAKDVRSAFKLFLNDLDKDSTNKVVVTTLISNGKKFI